MAGSIQLQSSQTLKQTLDQIFNSGQLSRLQYLQLVSTFLSDYKVTDEDRSQINRVFEELQTSRIRLVD